MNYFSKILNVLTLNLVCDPENMECKDPNLEFSNMKKRFSSFLRKMLGNKISCFKKNVRFFFNFNFSDV